MINSHKVSKDYYGGEAMPDGMRDCNSCGWYGKEGNFKYGLCPSCAPWEEEIDNFNHRAYDESENEYQAHLEMEAWEDENRKFMENTNE